MLHPLLFNLRCTLTTARAFKIRIVYFPLATAAISNDFPLSSHILAQHLSKRSIRISAIFRFYRRFADINTKQISHLKYSYSTVTLFINGGQPLAKYSRMVASSKNSMPLNKDYSNLVKINGVEWLQKTLGCLRM